MERSVAVEAVFEPVTRPSMFEETVARLGTAIRLGLLAPGTQLPPERELAEQLGISRSTLRHALTTLVQSGLLASARGRGGGTFVVPRPPLVSGEAGALGGDVRGGVDPPPPGGARAPPRAGEKGGRGPPGPPPRPPPAAAR